MRMDVTTVLVVGDFLACVVLLFGFFRLHSFVVLNEQRKNKKERCGELLQLLEMMIDHIAPFTLLRKEQVYIIQFHGCTEMYLLDCKQKLHEVIPCVHEDARLKLKELKTMIHLYLQSKRTSPLKLFVKKCVHCYRKRFSDMFDLEQKRESLNLVFASKTRKKLNRYCRQYLEDRAYIKNYFDEIISLLKAEYVQ